jgi:hypothetical protein
VKQLAWGFAPIGIVECWNNGIMGFGKMAILIYWEDHFVKNYK